MNIKSVEFILKRILEHSLPKEILPVIELLQDNPHRLHFVKDHNGCRNVIYFSTYSKYNSTYDYPYFSIFKGDEKEIGKMMVSHLPEEIYKNTKSFLENTKGTLYVSVGFEESEVSNLDYFSIYQLMEDTRCRVLDAYVSLRRFPDWYADEADYPAHILQEAAILGEMTSREKAYLLKKREEIVEELNKVVKKNDKEKFNELTTRIRLINSQLTEYKK